MPVPFTTSRAIRRRRLALAPLTTALSLIVATRLAAQGGQPTIVGVVFNPASVVGGRASTATITLDKAAGNTGADITLSITAGPAQLALGLVTIPSGATAATVTVTTVATPTLQVATLTATLRSTSRTANLTVTPPALTSLAVSPTTIATGQGGTGTVTLDGAAPPGGASISLASSSALLIVPASVAVAAGQQSATFQLSAPNAATGGMAIVTATFGGGSRTATVTIPSPPPPTPILTGLVVNPTALVSAPALGRVLLDRAAPPGGTTVAVTTSSTGVVTVPSTVVVPEGQLSREFTVTPASGVQVGATTVSASLGQARFSVRVTVTKPQFGISIVDAWKSGDPGVRYLVRVDQVPPGGATFDVNFTSNFLRLDAEFPRRLTVTTVPFSDYIISRASPLPVLSDDLPFSLSLTGMGATQVITSAILAPRLTGATLIDSVVGGQPAVLTLDLDASAPTTGLPVTFTSSNAAVTLVTPTGTGSGRQLQLDLATRAVSQRTSVDVTVAFKGTSQTQTIVLLPPAVRLTGFALSASSVSSTTAISAGVRLNAPAGARGVRVALSATSIVTAVLVVPTEIVVPAGATSASVTLKPTGQVGRSGSGSITATLGPDVIKIPITIP